MPGSTPIATQVILLEVVSVSRGVSPETGHRLCGTVGWWGHFHRSGVNSGVYTFGSDCINASMLLAHLTFAHQPSIKTEKTL